MIVLTYFGIGAVVAIVFVAMDRDEEFPPSWCVIIGLLFWPILLTVVSLQWLGWKLRDFIWK